MAKGPKGGGGLFSAETMEGRANVAKATYLGVAVIYFLIKMRKKAPEPAPACPPPCPEKKKWRNWFGRG